MSWLSRWNRPPPGSPRGRAAGEVAAGVVAEVEAEWAAHLGPRRTAALRDVLERLRETTDPRAGDDQ